MGSPMPLVLFLAGVASVPAVGVESGPPFEHAANRLAAVLAMRYCLLIVKDGEVVHENYFHNDTHTMYELDSLGKTAVAQVRHSSAPPVTHARLSSQLRSPFALSRRSSAWLSRAASLILTAPFWNTASHLQLIGIALVSIGIRKSLRGIYSRRRVALENLSQALGLHMIRMNTSNISRRCSRGPRR